jgi:methylated-DNA-[protein]-cysteine S-methyltransferase
VGRANATNPVCLVTPCHRVLGADGSLTGFGGGLEIKRRLLELERDCTQPPLFSSLELEALAADLQS